MRQLIWTGNSPLSLVMWPTGMNKILIDFLTMKEIISWYSIPFKHSLKNFPRNKTTSLLCGFTVMMLSRRGFKRRCRRWTRVLEDESIRWLMSDTTSTAEYPWDTHTFMEGLKMSELQCLRWVFLSSHNAWMICFQGHCCMHEAQGISEIRAKERSSVELGSDWRPNRWRAKDALQVAQSD